MDNERVLLSNAWAAAQPLLDALRSIPEVTRCSVAGSLRRFNELIGNLDFVVSSRQPTAVIKSFAECVGAAPSGSIEGGHATFVLPAGLVVHLRLVSDDEYATALVHFTGSKAHHQALRRRAADRGLLLDPQGIYRAARVTPGPALRIPCRDEEEVYAALDLASIPAELREDRGEIEAAARNELPRLIEWTDLRGSLHNHSTWSDGHNTLEEIARHMIDLGCEYWAITDHSRSSAIANGLDPDRLRQQLDAIGALNRVLAAEGHEFRLLTGGEVDILADGRLDFPDELLAPLDVVVASVHQAFTQPERVMTARLIQAVSNPFVHILGHMSGRLLLERPPCALDQRAVIDACAATGTWIELNANPRRFDLDWRLWTYAKSKGVRAVINCDGHRNSHAGYLRLGAGVARKGWLTRDDVVNTLPLADLRRELAKKARKPLP